MYLYQEEGGGKKRLLSLPAFCWSQVFPHVGSCPDEAQQAAWQVRSRFLMLTDSFSLCGPRASKAQKTLASRVDW